MYINNERTRKTKLANRTLGRRQTVLMHKKHLQCCFDTHVFSVLYVWFFLPLDAIASAEHMLRRLFCPSFRLSLSLSCMPVANNVGVYRPNDVISNRNFETCIR